MFHFFQLQIKMVREIVKVSFILIILIQFQTSTYYFLNASQSDTGSQVSIMSKIYNKSWDHEEEQVIHDSEITLENLDGLFEISRKMEHEELMIFEQRLLKLVGLKKRPVKDREKVKIPKYLAKLYETQIKSDLPTANLNLPGRLTRNANTVRSFYSSGKKINNMFM